MNSKSTAHEVRFKIIEYRSAVVFAENPAEAIEKARRLYADEPESDLFEITYDTDQYWDAEELQP